MSFYGLSLFWVFYCSQETLSLRDWWIHSTMQLIHHKIVLHSMRHCHLHRIHRIPIHRRNIGVLVIVISVLTKLSMIFPWLSIIVWSLLGELLMWGRWSKVIISMRKSTVITAAAFSLRPEMTKSSFEEIRSGPQFSFSMSKSAVFSLFTMTILKEGLTQLSLEQVWLVP